MTTSGIWEASTIPTSASLAASTPTGRKNVSALQRDMFDFTMVGRPSAIRAGDACEWPISVPDDRLGYKSSSGRVPHHDSHARGSVSMTWRLRIVVERRGSASWRR